MTLELFVYPPSPRSFKVLLLAEHLGLDYQAHIVDLTKGDQRRPAYAALNPNCRAPALRHGGYELWESGAILQYLASLKPQSGLMPPGRDGIDVARWQLWDAAHWDPAVAVFVFEHIVKPVVLGAGPCDEAAIQKCLEPFHRAARVLDSQLGGHAFVAGAAPTVADFSIGPSLLYAKEAHLPLDDYENIQRWSEWLKGLPAWSATAARWLKQ